MSGLAGAVHRHFAAAVVALVEVAALRRRPAAQDMPYGFDHAGRQGVRTVGAGVSLYHAI